MSFSVFIFSLQTILNLLLHIILQKILLFLEVCVDNEPIRRRPTEIKDFGKPERIYRRYMLTVKFGRGVDKTA
jgi:hypothetical protein